MAPFRWKAAGEAAMEGLGQSRPFASDRMAVRAWAWVKALAWTVAGSIALQAATSGMQLWERRQLAPQIEEMKAEQAWLVGQGLASPRRIDATGQGLFVHAGVAGRRAAMVQTWELGGGFDASIQLRAFDIAQSLATRRRLLRASYAISAGEKGGYFAGGLALAYRHEEGHALSREFNIGPGAPAAWPSDVSLVLGKEIMAIRDADPEAPWRSRLLAELWDEAFADAYAVLANARRPARAFKSEALALHAQRSMPSNLADSAISSLDAAGNGHAVDMSSFVAGQLDQGKAASLSKADLLALSAGVADASMAWGLARQAPLLSFFDGEGLGAGAGRSWFMIASARWGLPAARAEAAWDAWRRASLRPKPEAAFGRFSWKRAGFEFRARGLAGGDSKDWRFDGFGGAVADARALDPGRATPYMAELDPEGARRAMDRRLARIELGAERMGTFFDAAARPRMTMAGRLGLPLAPERKAIARLKAELVGASDGAATPAPWKAPSNGG